MDIIAKLEQGCHTDSPEATEHIATQLGARLPNNTTLALQGDLGVGKTTFVKGLARAWSIQDVITSPTYNLFNIYNGTRQLVHFDAYRLEQPEEVDALMLDEFLQPPYCFVVEWPERLSSDWLEPAWKVVLGITDTEAHSIQLVGRTPT